MLSIDGYIEGVLKNELINLLEKKGLEKFIEVINGVILCYRYKSSNIYVEDIRKFYIKRARKWEEARKQFLEALDKGSTPLDAITKIISLLKESIEDKR